MAQVNMYDAKTHFSRLVARALAGEEIVVARAGKPVVKLVPVGPEASPRRLGTLAGFAEIADDFDAPLPAEELAAFTDGALLPDAEDAKR